MSRLMLKNKIKNILLRRLKLWDIKPRYKKLNAQLIGPIM